MKYSLLVLVLAITLGCSKQQSRETVTEVIDLPYFVDAELNVVWPDDKEATELHRIADFSFTSQDGVAVTNETFDGKFYVTNFFFSICPNVCPRMTNNLKKVQAEFKDDERVLLASHTVMPWVDSVARLKEYAVLNEIVSDKWYLLTGDKKAIYKVARESYFADEGFGKTITSEEDFLHTESIILVDDNRHIRGVYNGTLPLDVRRLIDDIHYLLEHSS